MEETTKEATTDRDPLEMATEMVQDVLGLAVAGAAQRPEVRETLNHVLQTAQTLAFLDIAKSLREIRDGGQALIDTLHDVGVNLR